MVYVFHTTDLSRAGTYRELPWAQLACPAFTEADLTAFRRENKFSVAELIRDVADEVRQNFIDFVGRLAESQTDKVVWYSSCLASKSVSQTDIFHQYVYMKLVEKLACHDQERVLVTGSDALVWHLSRQRPANVTVVSAAGALHPLPPRRRGVLKRLRYAAQWLQMVLRAKPELRDADCLLHTWIDERLFRSSPEEGDPYFGDLARYLSQEGRRVVRMGPLAVKGAMVRRMEQSYPGTVWPLAYLPLRMMWRCLWEPFRVRMNPEMFGSLSDQELLMHLVGHEVEKENRVRNYFVYLLYYRSYRELAKRLPRELCVIFPYENQPWEKMLNLALPGVRRIGYQHSTIPVNWLDYYTSADEVNEPRPDLVLTAGPCWTDFIRASNKHVTVREAGSFRYRYLWEQGPQPAPADGRKDILIALPLDPVTALGLQEQLLQLLADARFESYRFRIKPHPQLSARYVKADRLRAYAHCEITDTPIAELLSECALCVTVDSTVVLESVLLGVRSIAYLPEDLTQGMEYFVKDEAYPASEADFCEVFAAALQADKRPSADARYYFTPVRYDLFAEQVGGGQAKEKAKVS